ncbi:MAG: hypothetical protein ACOX6U_01140 [Oscillospiraceae bacterium]
MDKTEKLLTELVRRNTPSAQKLAALKPEPEWQDPLALYRQMTLLQRSAYRPCRVPGWGGFAGTA